MAIQRIARAKPMHPKKGTSSDADIDARIHAHEADLRLRLHPGRGQGPSRAQIEARIAKPSVRLAHRQALRGDGPPA
jgi:hypothetical protein